MADVPIRKVVASAGAILDAMLTYHSAEAQVEEQSPCLVVLEGGIEYPLDNLKADILTRALPRDIPLPPLSHKSEDGEVHIQTPPLPEVQSAFGALPEVQTGWSPLREFGLMVGIPGEMLDPRKFDTAKALCLFEALPEERQPEAFKLVARSLAVGRVSLWVAELFLDVYSEGWRQLDDSPYTTITATAQSDFLINNLSVRRRARGQIEAVLWFLDMVNWTDRATTIPPGQEFLPPGGGDQGGGGEVRDFALGAEIAAGDERLAPERDLFYRDELKCSCLEALGRYFGSRRYVAYVYRLPSGQLVIILDSPVIGNAAYLFLVPLPGAGNPEDWINDAIRPKGELRSAPDDRRGTFRRRFIHARAWKEKVLKYLQGL